VIADRIAAIDVGSNTVLLTVAQLDADSLTTIHEAEDQPRLGAALRTTGRLSDEAMSRALEVLAAMRDACDRLEVSRISAVATAAVREAANGVEFVQRVQALEIPLRLISPDEEAALAYRSAAYRFPGSDRMLVADIGGGSLELIGAASGAVNFLRSLPLGAVRLTEMQLPPEELHAHIRNLLRAGSAGVEAKGSRIIGSGGTLATLASMVLAARGEAPAPVHGTMVSAEEVGRFELALADMSSEQRGRVPGLKPERADIIVAGIAVVAELLKAVDSDGVTVSGYGLRDGLLLEMAGLS
jgi:exopolyphosphatase / guanosine-5'-triphosphate,3'-diphosphate pyrophosphatase